MYLVIAIMCVLWFQTVSTKVSYDLACSNGSASCDLKPLALIDSACVVTC